MLYCYDLVPASSVFRAPQQQQLDAHVSVLPEFTILLTASTYKIPSIERRLALILPYNTTPPSQVLGI